MSLLLRFLVCVVVMLVGMAILPRSAESQESVGAGSLPGSTPSPEANVARIEFQLGRPTVVEEVETPLAELLAVTLADRHDIRIHFDTPAIEEAGATSDVAVTWALRDISLASALDLILGEHGLAYLVRDEVLVITSQEAEAAWTEARVYGVADLIAGDGSMDSLLETVRIGLDRGRLKRKTAEGDNAYGSPGEEPADAGPSVTAYRDVLIVRDTQRRHRALTQLLAGLRAELHQAASAVDPVPR